MRNNIKTLKSWGPNLNTKIVSSSTAWKKKNAEIWTLFIYLCFFSQGVSNTSHIAFRWNRVSHYLNHQALWIPWDFITSIGYCIKDFPVFSVHCVLKDKKFKGTIKFHESMALSSRPHRALAMMTTINDVWMCTLRKLTEDRQLWNKHPLRTK